MRGSFLDHFAHCISNLWSCGSILWLHGSMCVQFAPRVLELLGVAVLARPSVFVGLSMSRWMENRGSFC